MSDTTDDDDLPKKETKIGTLLVFPGGKTIDTTEVGADYILTQGGQVTTPELIDRLAAAADLKEREKYVKNQELVRSLKEKASVSDIVDLVMEEIGEELAHLKYERKKAAKDGKNTANYTISRISSLKQLADSLMKRMENARNERMDIRSPEFKKILHLWLEYVHSSMVKQGLQDATIDLVFKQMEVDMKDWEQILLDKVD